MFFDQLGCILCENASPFVDVNRCFPRGITEVELTHPVVCSNAAADNDQMNKKLVSKAEYSWKEFDFIVQFRENFKEGEKKESKVVCVIPIALATLVEEPSRKCPQKRVESVYWGTARKGV
jgi:uncharacterized protein YeaO (DUF488 family)